MSPGPLLDEPGGKYLDVQTVVTQWQNFIAEDRRSFSPLENRLFGWDFKSANVPGDAPGTGDYWVQISLFNGSKKKEADELFRALKKHIPNLPDSGLSDRNRERERYAVRIGPFKYDWEAWRVARDIMTTR
ncbi:hypothetical protein AGMMS49944_13230 [Spirochaetia bacterium]|nr:hypothetical protein AGMMS49944_13230 [Spirochaetia bacterium]